MEKKTTSNNRLHHRRRLRKNLEEATQLVPLLLPTRANECDDWLRVGWTLFNISEGNQRGLNLWTDFSKRTTRT